MATLRNHPGYWMRDDAEASLARWEADHGIIGVNSAGRTVAEQQHLINRWNQGGVYNRPPYLYEPKRPASASSHVANGGIAFDTSEHARFRRTCADYGWWQPYDWDVVHFEYNPSRDKHRNRPAGESTPNHKEEDVIDPIAVTFKKTGGQPVKAKTEAHLHINDKAHVSVSIGAAKNVSGTLTVWIKGPYVKDTTPLTAVIQVIPVLRTITNGKESKVQSLGAVEVPFTSGKTIGKVSVDTGKMAADQRLSFKIGNSPHDATVEYAEFRGMKLS